jgi:hypothetical protein
MANDTGNFGLRAARQLDGTPYNGAQNRYRILKNYGTAIFQGDLVKQVTGGGIERVAASSTVPVVGVFNGCMYTDPTTSEQVFSNYYPASTNASDIIAFIIDDPNVVFEVQSDDTFPVADLFGNFEIIDTNSGSTLTGISGMELDLSSGATTTTLPLKAIDISQDPDNSDVSSSNTNVLVVIQNHICGVKSAGLA